MLRITDQKRFHLKFLIRAMVRKMPDQAQLAVFAKYAVLFARSVTRGTEPLKNKKISEVLDFRSGLDGSIAVL